MVVVYSNMKAFREKKLQSAVLRFYGTAKVHESGPIKDAIFAQLKDREQKHERADAGFGVLAKIDRAEDRRGRPLE